MNGSALRCASIACHQIIFLTYEICEFHRFTEARKQIVEPFLFSFTACAARCSYPCSPIVAVVLSVSNVLGSSVYSARNARSSPRLQAQAAFHLNHSGSVHTAKARPSAPSERTRIKSHLALRCVMPQAPTAHASMAKSRAIRLQSVLTCTEIRWSIRTRAHHLRGNARSPVNDPATRTK